MQQCGHTDTGDGQGSEMTTEVLIGLIGAIAGAGTGILSVWLQSRRNSVNDMADLSETAMRLIEPLQERIDILENDLAKLQEAHQDLIVQYQHLLARHEKLQSQYDQLQQEYHDLLRKYQGLTSDAC